MRHNIVDCKNKEDLEGLLQLSDDYLGKLFRLYLLKGNEEISLSTLSMIWGNKMSSTYLILSKLLELNLIFKNKNGKYVLSDVVKLPDFVDV